MAEKFIPEGERAGWINDNNEDAKIGFFNLRWEIRWNLPTQKNRKNALEKAHAIRGTRRKDEQSIRMGVAPY